MLHDSKQVLDGYLNEERVILHCGTHNYAGPGTKTLPTDGCQKCAHVLIYSLVARKEGNKLEALGELEDIIHALIELDEEGSFDYKSGTDIQISKGND